MMKWLDKIPMFVIALPALLLAVMPITPQPHLVEKLNMLLSGALTKPIDIIDLFFHGSLLLILGLKLIRTMVQNKHQNND